MTNQNGDQLIPLSIASQKTDYSEGHLNLLCRLGKLECQKLGRNWYTSEQALWQYTTKRSNGGKLPVVDQLITTYHTLSPFTKIALLGGMVLILLHGIQAFGPKITTIGEDGMEVKELTISPIQIAGDFLSGIVEKGKLARERLIAQILDRIRDEQVPTAPPEASSITAPSQTRSDSYFSTLKTNGTDLVLAPSKGKDVVVKSDLIVDGNLVHPEAIIIDNGGTLNVTDGVNTLVQIVDTGSGARMNVDAINANSLTSKTLSTGDVGGFTLSGNITGSGSPTISGIGGLAIGSTAATTDALWVNSGKTRLDGDLVVGGDTSDFETISNPAFTTNGNDLFVAGSAGVEGSLYADDSLVVGGSGAAATLGNNTLSFSGLAPTISAADEGKLTITDSRGNALFTILDSGSSGTIECNNCIDASDISATLTFSAGDFIDLVSITHDTSTPQGLRLPSASSATPTSPSSGEGYLAWDASGNQLITYDGSSWTTSGGGSGDITAVVAGSGLTGGATSGSATLNAGAGTGITVNADDIAINQAFTPTWSALHTFSSATPITLSSTSPAISIGNTGTLTINDGTNTLLTLADSGTTGNLTVDTATLTTVTCTGCIETTDIAADTIVAGDIATNGVDAAEIAADAVGTSEIASNAVDDSEIVDTLTYTGALTLTPGSTSDVIANGDADSNFQIASTVASDVSINVADLTLTASGTGATGTLNGLAITNAAAGGTTTPDNLVYLNQADTDETVTNGIFIENTGAGTITSAIQITETAGTITTGITLGANLGTGIDAGANIIANIGNSGTDFDTSGGLTLASTLTLSNNTLSCTACVETTDIAADTIAAGDIAAGAVGTSELTDDSIGEVDLNVTGADAAADEECLTFESTDGDFEWQTCGAITADSLDFIDFEDSLDLDAATDINAGTNLLSIDLDSTGDFAIRDGTTNVVLFEDDSTIDVTFPAAGTLTIDAAATDNTTTAGVINLDLDTATSGNIGSSIDYQVVDAAGNVTGYGEKIDVTVDTDAAQSHTVAGSYIGITANDASSTTYGLQVVAEDAGGQVATAGILIENLQATDIDLTTGLLIRATTGDSIATAVDVSDAEITTGLSIGANTLAGTTGIINYDNFDVDGSGNLDAAGTLTSGSSNTAVTLSTGLIDADALTLTTAADGGSGTSSGSGFIARSDGIGLLQGCSDTQILKWVESTDTWDCAADADSGGSTAFSAIGDPAGNGAIAMGATVQTFDWTDFTANANFFSFNFDNNGGTAGTDQGVLITNAVSTATTGDLNTEALLLLDQADTTTTGTTAVDDALLITNSGGSTLTDAIQIGTGSQAITNAINIVSTGVTTDISLQNGETIDNNTDGTVAIGGTTFSISSATTLNCTDCIDGDDLVDAIALDANTSITQDGTETFTITNSGSGNTILNLSSTGDFVIQDNGAAYMTFTDSGTLTIAGAVTLSGIATDITSGTNEDIDISPNGTGELIGRKERRILTFIEDNLSGGASNEYIARVPPSFFNRNIWLNQVACATNTAPGVGETVTCEVTDGTNILTCTVSEGDSTCTGTSTAHQLAIASETLTIRYDSSATHNASDLTVLIEYYEE